MKKTKAKQILVYLVILFILLGILPGKIYAQTITLEQIAEKFNRSSIVNIYEETGGSINATSDTDTLNVTAVADEGTESVIFLIEGNILSTEIDKEESSVFTKLYITAYIIDIIGQLYGYEEGELAQTVNSEEAKNYTLEQEGFETKETTNKYQIRIDLSRKVPLIDFSSTYIEVSDLEGNLKEFIAGNGSAQKNKGNLILWKGGYDNEMTVFIGEKKLLTENTYKSILSMLQVMFNSENVVNYFKMNYPEISIGNKEFTGFKVEINPEKTNMEKTVLGEGDEYSFIRLTIDKATAIEAATKTTVANINNSDEINQNITQLPQTGEGLQMTDLLTGLIVISVIGLIVLYISNEKQK